MGAEQRPHFRGGTPATLDGAVHVPLPALAGVLPREQDEAGRPGTPVAFVAAPGQGVNLRRGAWHGVCCPLAAPGLFAVVDRIGEGANLEEHWFDEPWAVLAPSA